jgi:nucleoside 2-deoxyribosyltransferase
LDLSSTGSILVVGDVFVDYHADLQRIRLGGIFHAARTLHALNVPYSVAHTAPDYLLENVEKFLHQLGARAYARIGAITGSPAVMVIKESREIGNQGYDEILRDASRTVWTPDVLTQLLSDEQPTDALVFPGHFPLSEAMEILATAGVRIHIDTQYETDLPDTIKRHGRPISTLFCSTSSPLFQREVGADPTRLRTLLDADCSDAVVLKENRGGSRVFLGDANAPIHAPSFPTKTAHSVGVGDCFDCTWIAARDSSPDHRLTRAAYYASLYASTWDHARFVEDIRAAEAMGSAVTTLQGIRLPWEMRKDIHIYIAAPDFPRINVSVLDELESALNYHNFTPHRPVREHGICTPSTPPADAASMYCRDVDLLDRCKVLIAVPLVTDPGTFVEMGFAAAKCKPVILFEATSKVENLFAETTATRTCRALAEVIDSLFEIVSVK